MIKAKKYDMLNGYVYLTVNVSEEEFAMQYRQLKTNDESSGLSPKTLEGLLVVNLNKEEMTFGDSDDEDAKKVSLYDKML